MKRNYPRTLVLLALLSTNLWANELDIRKLMPSEELDTSGISDLNDKQVEIINQWLIRYTAHKAPQLRKTSSQVVTEIENDQETFINGSFSGWTGKTKFTMKDGSRWQQRLPGRWFTSATTSPPVIIRRTNLGFYKMTVITARGKKTIGIKRLN